MIHTKDVTEPQVGMTVKHIFLGAGKIVAIEADGYLSVLFAGRPKPYPMERTYVALSETNG